MGKVTFACECAQSHVEASLTTTADVSPAGDLLFEQSGKTTLELPRGVYNLAYRAQGTPDTPFSLKVSGEATMTPVDRVLAPDGLAAGVRTVVVRALLLPIALTPPPRCIPAAWITHAAGKLPPPVMAACPSGIGPMRWHSS